MAKRKRSKVSANFNMSSLTDIIFLLLIFFMLTSSVVSPHAINLKLPSSTRKPAKSTAQPLRIEADAAGRINFNGSFLSEEELPAALGAAIQADGRSPEEITAILSIHEAANAQLLVNLVEELNKKGLKMVLSTKKDD